MFEIAFSMTPARTLYLTRCFYADAVFFVSTISLFSKMYLSLHGLYASVSWKILCQWGAAEQVFE